jgi:hypothetical protein
MPAPKKIFVKPTASELRDEYLAHEKDMIAAHRIERDRWWRRRGAKLTQWEDVAILHDRQDVERQILRRKYTMLIRETKED